MTGTGLLTMTSCAISNQEFPQHFPLFKLIISDVLPQRQKAELLHGIFHTNCLPWEIIQQNTTHCCLSGSICFKQGRQCMGVFSKGLKSHRKWYNPETMEYRSNTWTARRRGTNTWTEHRREESALGVGALEGRAGRKSGVTFHFLFSLAVLYALAHRTPSVQSSVLFYFTVYFEV